MSQNLPDVVEAARSAVRTAQDQFRALSRTVDSRSIPESLWFAETALAKLLITLDGLLRSRNALSSKHAYDTFEATVSGGVKLSSAIVNDLNTTARRLQLMIPSDLSQSTPFMEQHEYRDLAQMIDGYDRIISSIMFNHQSSSVDHLVDYTHDVLNEMGNIGQRVRHRQESTDSDLRTKVHDKLLPLASASYFSKDAKPGCLPGTRVALLEELSEWANDDALRLTTMWLNGVSGKGKTAIATSFAENMDSQMLLGHGFFIDGRIAERQDPYRIAHTLAYDLALQSHDQYQVQSLIQKPMEASRDHQTKVIVIDGLDACTPPGGARLLTILTVCLADLPIKLFVASRQDPDIIASFENIPHTEIRLQDQPEEVVANDARQGEDGGGGDDVHGDVIREVEERGGMQP